MNVHVTKASGTVVVGAGPAGITCALELAAQGVDVVLIESGLGSYSKSIQDLSKLQSFDPEKHAPMEIATRRQLGGASVIWGGRCVPFDRIDFEERAFVPYSNWPIGYDEIEPFHAAAANYFRCGSAVFNTHQIPTVRQKTIVPELADGDVLSSELERWSLPTNFGREYRKKIESSSKIQHLAGFTATKIDIDGESGHVQAIEGADLNGDGFRVEAKNYVLAAGGLETTRLLLQPAPSFPHGIGNSSDWLGRCYMGHISGQIADVEFHGKPRDTQFGFLRDSDGVYLRQRFTFSPESQRKHEFNNMAIWLVNPKIGDPGHRNGVLSFAYLALSSPLGRFFASEAIRQSAIGDAKPNSAREHIANMVRQLPGTLAFIATFGIKRFLLRRRVPGFFQLSESNKYPLHFHGEQIPHRDSRVTLSTERDCLGLLKLIVDFRFAKEDITSVVKAHELLDQSLRAQNAGSLRYHCDDLEESVWRQAKDGYHQAGTTRMSATPNDGVVDENCRVHGTQNLYVASSSVFPTSGQANSTFLIVALSIRLAQHLATQSGQE